MTSLSYASAVAEEKAGAGSQWATRHRASTASSLPSLSAVVRVLLADRGSLRVTPIMVVGCRRSRPSLRARVAGGGLCDRRDHARRCCSTTRRSRSRRPGSTAVTARGRGTSTSRCRSLVLPLGLVFTSAPTHRRRAPGGVAVVRMTMATATQPMVGSEGTAQWIRRIRPSDFTDTVFTGLGVGHGWLAITPFLLVVCAAAVAASGDAARGRHDLGLAVCNHGRRMGWVTVAGRLTRHGAIGLVGVATLAMPALPSPGVAYVAIRELSPADGQGVIVALEERGAAHAGVTS